MFCLITGDRYIEAFLISSDELADADADTASAFASSIGEAMLQLQPVSDKDVISLFTHALGRECCIRPYSFIMLLMEPVVLVT
jgi:hypothetical protein